MTTLLARIGAYAVAYRYGAVFLLAAVEGPMTMVAGGFLVRLGVFNLIPLYAFLLMGDLTGDIFWYWVGRTGALPFLERYGRFLSVTDEMVERVKGIFQRHGDKILFFSKITMGFGFALVTLMTAGATRIPLRRFLFLNFSGGLLWVGFLVGLGYFLGNLYSSIEVSFQSLSIGALVVVLGAALYGFSRFMRSYYAVRL